ncbi:uncharacterized protein LOC119016623 [Acanthopagrus latus]|uniref:uncharacterized protein LOC119016623 n=1 Tax=Acanthopagrus latus TaxID=8177 RepID=UPI00187BCCAE|nr:uncharacterized protein LOC119016623 [Acanthopagrus latus]XP_036948543.1 uncharacterized protein LOC119016623 [Acanthopagrus latus]
MKKRIVTQTSACVDLLADNDIDIHHRASPTKPFIPLLQQNECVYAASSSRFSRGHAALQKFLVSFRVTRMLQSSLCEVMFTPRREKRRAVRDAHGRLSIILLIGRLILWIRPPSLLLSFCQKSHHPSTECVRVFSTQSIRQSDRQRSRYSGVVEGRGGFLLREVARMMEGGANPTNQPASDRSAAAQRCGGRSCELHHQVPQLLVYFLTRDLKPFILKKSPGLQTRETLLHTGCREKSPEFLRRSDLSDSGRPQTSPESLSPGRGRQISRWR